MTAPDQPAPVPVRCDQAPSAREASPTEPPQALESTARSVAMSVVEEYSGDVLHPRIAQGWEEICPGAAHRLLRMAEKQEDHRIWWERQTLIHGAAFQYLGLMSALLISLGLVIGAVYCATIDQPWVSAACLAAGAVSMVKAFLEHGSKKRLPPARGEATSPAPAQKTPPPSPNKPQGKRRP